MVFLWGHFMTYFLRLNILRLRLDRRILQKIASRRKIQLYGTPYMMCSILLIFFNWNKLAKKSVDKNAGLSVSHKESHLNTDPSHGRRYWHWLYVLSVDKIHKHFTRISIEHGNFFDFYKKDDYIFCILMLTYINLISTVQRAPFDKMYGKKVLHLKDNFNTTLIIKIVPS